MTKDKMIKALSEFMAEKGVETMDLKTYKSFGNEVPVKDYLLKDIGVLGIEYLVLLIKDILSQ